MLKSPYLFAVSLLIALIHWTGTAKAQELNLGLSFELPPVESQSIAPNTEQPASPQDIPQAKPTVPLRIEIASLPTAEVSTEAILKVPPDEIPLANLDIAELAYQPRSLPPLVAVDGPAQPNNDMRLRFDQTTNLLGSSEFGFDAPSSSVSKLGAEANRHDDVDDAVQAASVSETLGVVDDWIFEHGTQSLVARTVGSAEGTRQLDGQRTEAYYGHVDPGNGVWNLGTFSYQHGARSPEEADEKQLQRLKRQGIELEAQASKQGFTLSLEEKLNGLDLANQAPLAALDRGGYIDRLVQAKRLSMDRDEAILWARTHAYIDPDTQQWNAPGLGNNISSISRDQDRRMVAISEALKAYEPMGSSMASLSGVEDINLQRNGLAGSAGLNSPAIAQRILADIEVSFGLPPVDPEDLIPSSTVVAAAPEESAATQSSLRENASGSNRAPEDQSVVNGSHVGLAFLPTEETSTVASDSSTESAETAQNTSTEPATPAEPAAIAKDAEETANEASSTAEEPSPATQLKTLLKGIPAQQIEEEAEKPSQSAEPSFPWGSSLWRTEDKVIQTK